MNAKVLVAALLTLLLLLGGEPRAARADEMCPGCSGKGKVGCGNCTSVGYGAFVGKCSNCSGFTVGNVKPGEQCPICKGTQVCQTCAGKGAQCLVCRGTGKVPNGTARVAAETDQKAQQAGLEKNLKKRLGFLVGRWKGEGEDAEQGKFETEMRWTSVLDGAFLRHEERSTFASGAVQEYVSYLTWLESEKRYLWVLLFAPGKGLQLKGAPSTDGASIVWELPLASGAVLKMTWSLKPSEKRLDIVNAVASGETSKTTGKCKWERSAAEPGDPLVDASARKEGDAETDAVLEGMKPLRFLLGEWRGTGQGEKAKRRTEAKWTEVLGGTFLETEGASTYPDGSKLRSRSVVSWVPNEKKVLIITFESPGRISVYKGSVEKGDDGAIVVTLALPGGRLIWSGSEDGKKLDWRIELAAAGGGWKAFEKGVDKKE